MLTLYRPGNGLLHRMPAGLKVLLLVAVVLGVSLLPAAWWAAGLGLLVAWSRIYIGVHYPLDMLGAAILAVPLAMASLWIMDRHGKAILSVLEHLQALALRPLARRMRP